MRSSSAAILDEHLAALDHLYVVVFSELAIRIEIEKWPHPAQDALNVLSVSLELVVAYAVVDRLELGLGVAGRPLATLLHEGLEREPVLGVDAGVVVQSVEEDQAVCQEEGFVLAVEVLGVLPLVRVRELLDDSLDLIALTWKPERGQKLADRFVDRSVTVVKLGGEELEDFLVDLFRRRQVLADRELAQTRLVLEEL